MPSSSELRVLVLAPTAKDAELTRSIFSSRAIVSTVCPDVSTLYAELQTRGAGAILVAEEVLVRAEGLRLWIERQQTWSDMPLLVIARPGADSAIVTAAMAELGNVTVLERPIRVSALLSSVQVALRARKRQYQLRQQLSDLESARAALQQADVRKDEFLAILAHELRNPLAPISNGLELLKRSGNSDPAFIEIGQMMDRQVGNLNRLVDDLLEVSRITRDKVELHKETVALGLVLQTAIEASQPLIDASGHQLSLTLPAAMPLLQADPLRLSQVFANLLNNAAKFTEPGGHIRVSVQVEAEALVVSVRDDGIGIRPEMQSRIFELFAQANQDTNHVQGGLGIGLMLVKRLVELHGGTVKVFSEGLGRGSEFVVRLALSQHVPPAVGLSASTNPPQAARVQKRILVIDDNRDAAATLGQLLQLWGAEIRVGHSGQEALAILEEFHADVAILDIGMKGMDGLELAGRIREQAELRGMFLIALTGWGQQEDVRKTLKAGFDRHLVKPVNFDVLEAVLLNSAPVTA